jgi:hypothetical protein
MTIKNFFRNFFRKGRPCIYCGLKTRNLGHVFGSIHVYRVCEKCQEILRKESGK